jgi:hypothetical protein
MVHSPEYTFTEKALSEFNGEGNFFGNVKAENFEISRGGSWRWGAISASAFDLDGVVDELTPFLNPNSLQRLH